MNTDCLYNCRVLANWISANRMSINWKIIIISIVNLLFLENYYKHDIFGKKVPCTLGVVYYKLFRDSQKLTDLNWYTFL